ncbi:MAG: class I SAM-dependent methyltransferase [Gemmataceae bacterium]
MSREETRRRLAAKNPKYAALWGLPGPGADEPAAPPPGRWLRIPDPPPVAFTPTKPRAVVTVAVGDEGRALLGASGGHLGRYAAECDADFIVLDDWPGPDGWPMGAKLRLGRVLDLGYEQVAYIDADVLARPGAVDLFDLCPPDEFGICDELTWHRRQPQHGLEAGFARFRRAMGLSTGPLEWYGNAGVMVFGQSHREVLTPPAELWVEDAGLNRHCAEQHLWNARLMAGGARVKHLPRPANWQSWTCSDMLRLAPASALLHWSGAGRNRAGRVRAITAAAAANPWPGDEWVPPAALFPAGPPPHSIDPTHARMIRDELMTGRYGRVLEVGCWHGYSTSAFLDAYRSGQVGEVHLCEPYPRPELRRVIDWHARDQLSYRVTLHEKTSYDLLTADANFDFAFLDGDHAEAAVRDEAYRLAVAGCRTIFAHDVSPASHEKYGTDPGPRVLPALLESMGYDVAVDDKPRPGERTERGLLKATRRKPTPPAVRLSVVVATKGRDTLARALASIATQLRPGDELIVQCDDSGDVGATPRTAGVRKATGTHLLFMDDDDVYTPGALDVVRAAMLAAPGRCHLFGMTSGQGWTLPHGDRDVRVGNVSTQMFVCPNDKARLGEWGPRRTGDFDFIRSTLDKHEQPPVWHDEVIAVWRPA